MAKLGLLGMHLKGYGCAGRTAVEYGLAAAGARGRRLRPAHLRLRAGLAGHERHLQARLRGAEAGVAAADGRRRGDRLLRPDRAHRRVGPVEHDDLRPPATATTGSSTAPSAGSAWPPSPRSPIIWAQTDDGVRGFVVPTETAGIHGHADRAQAVDARLHPVRHRTHRRASARRRGAAERQWPARAVLLPERGPLRHHLGRHGCGP